MRLQGILDKAFGNFISLRGYARMGDLDRVSVADQSYQRSLIEEHQDEMVNFLRSGEFLFFPEVILGITLEPDDGDMDKINRFHQSFAEDISFRENFDQVNINYSVTKFKKWTDKN